jgi:hypothetical protein
LAIASTKLSAQGSPLLEKHRLTLLGSIPCAARRMATELLRRTMVEGQAPHPVPLGQNPILKCALHEAIRESICEQFRDDPCLEEISINSWSTQLTPLQVIIDEATLYDDVYWPRQFEIRIIRTKETVTVSYDDWSMNNNEPVVLYHAALLSRPPSS